MRDFHVRMMLNERHPILWVLASVNLSHLASLASWFRYQGLLQLRSPGFVRSWPSRSSNAPLRALVDGGVWQQRFIPFQPWAFCRMSKRFNKAQELKRDNLQFCKALLALLQRRREEIQEIEVAEGKEGKKGTERNGKRSQNRCGDLLFDCFLKTPYESEDHRAADIAMFLLAGHRQVASLHFASIVWCKLQNAWQKLRMKSIVCLGMPESPARLCSKTSATPWPASQNPCLCGRWSQKAVPGVPDSTRQPDQSPTLPCSDQRLGVPIVRLPHRRGGWTIARRLKISERSGPVLVDPLRSRSFHSVVICFVTLLWGLHDLWVWKNEP